MLTKALIVKATVFSVVMYRCESWTIKKPEHWRTDDLELWYWRRLLRILGLQEDQTLVNSEGNQLWIFTRKTNALALAKPPVLWPPDVKSWLLRGKNKKTKKTDAGKGWRQEEKGMTEDQMVGLHHWLNGYEFEWTPGDVEDREACCATVHGVTMS